jgi:hypothetical protein
MLANRLLQGKKTLAERMLEKDDLPLPSESESSSAVTLFDELAAANQKGTSITA